MSVEKNLAIAAGLCAVFGLTAWAFYVHAFAGVRGEDWMVYYTAVRSYFDGQVALLYDGQNLTRLLNARFASWLAHPLPLHPWLYPPLYLLLLLPFGLASFAVSRALFLALGFAAMLAAGFVYARRRRARLILTLSLALCPATAVTVCLGQNTFFTSALLLGGFGLLGRSPVLGGALLGVLTYKPQLWLMVPVALIASRQWKALAAAAVTVALLALASVAVFGIEPWRAWIELMVAPSPLFAKWSVIARLNGQAVYTYAMLLGASAPLANGLQAIAALIAAACVWWCYRRNMAADLRLAVLLGATVLAAPHIIDYDALLLGIAASLVFLRGLDDGLGIGETLLLVLLWVSPFFNPPSVFPVAYGTPFLILGFMVWVMRRAHGRAFARPPEIALDLGQH